MTNLSSFRLISILLLAFLIIACQSGQDQPELNEQAVHGDDDSNQNQQNQEIVDFVEKLLFAAGNKNVDAMKELIFDEAIVGNTSLNDEKWITRHWTIDEIYDLYQDDQSIPYLEIVDDYEIIVTERMALVKADAVINRFGVPGKREINHMTLIKSNDQWKLFSIAWPVYQQPEEKLKFDIDIFARGYAQVWGSQRSDFVAMFYEEDGSLQVNDGEPAKGRSAISDLAQGFMTQFPDMNVSYDSLVQKPDGIEFHWTFTGTDADPNGKGHKVNVSGYEFWTMSDGNLIKESKGHFPTEEYNRQLESGIKQ